MRTRPETESAPESARISLAPLFDAASAIPLHAVAAMTALVLGIVQLSAPKGTLPHRTIGWIWVVLMAAVALSSFWIHQIRLVAAHRRTMIAIFTGGLVVAGLFTLLPGRITHAVLFGP